MFKTMFGNRQNPNSAQQSGSKKLSEIFQERGYLFICEFCEFEGAKTLYTYPEFTQSNLGENSEESCIKKRLAREFLSSNPCTPASEGNLSLKNEAQFYKEMEIGGKHDQIMTDNGKPLMLYCLGTLFKVRD